MGRLPRSIGGGVNELEDGPAIGGLDILLDIFCMDDQEVNIAHNRGQSIECTSTLR